MFDLSFHRANCVGRPHLQREAAAAAPHNPHEQSNRTRHSASDPFRNGELLKTTVLSAPPRHRWCAYDDFDNLIFRSAAKLVLGHALVCDGAKQHPTAGVTMVEKAHLEAFLDPPNRPFIRFLDSAHGGARNFNDP